MPLLDLIIQHGRTLVEARGGLEVAVNHVSGRFGALFRKVEWSGDRDRVKLEGIGFWVEMSPMLVSSMRWATSRYSSDCSVGRSGQV